jgi:hypothetical protein
VQLCHGVQVALSVLMLRVPLGHSRQTWSVEALPAWATYAPAGQTVKETQVPPEAYVPAVQAISHFPFGQLGADSMPPQPASGAIQHKTMSNFDEGVFMVQHASHEQESDQARSELTS